MISLFSTALLSMTLAPVQQAQPTQVQPVQVQPATPAQPVRTQSTTTQSTADRANMVHETLDGTWMVVCFEKNGMPVAEMKDKTVMVKDNMITCSEGGNAMKTMKVQFEPKGKLTVWEKDAATPSTTTINPSPNNPNTTDNMSREAKHGSYILTQGFAAICLHEETAAATPTTVVTPNGRETTSAYRPEMKSVCTIFLKRVDNK